MGETNIADKVFIKGPGRVAKEAFHFTVGDELWTLNMRKQAIKEACMEIRLVGGRSLLAHSVEKLGWNPLLFLSDVLGIGVFINIPPSSKKMFETICCKDCDVDKTMQVFMLFVARMERTAIEALDNQTKKEYKGLLVGNWHPMKLLSKVFKDVMVFYLGEKIEKKTEKPKRSRKKSG